MLAGNAAQFPGSFFASIRTLTAHIALVLATDSQSMAYQSVFASGLLLFLLMGAFNFIIQKSGRQKSSRKTGDRRREKNF
jgi:phosphate transport system permease protein